MVLAMFIRRIPFLLIAICFSLGLNGCAFEVDFEPVNVRLSFSVDELVGAFTAEQTYIPDDNPDIKNNRDKLEDSTVQISNVTVVFTSIGQDNQANFAWGRVYAYPKEMGPSDVLIKEDLSRACDDAASIAAACFDAVPVRATKTTTDKGVQRGGLNLDISADQKANIVDLLLNNPELAVKVVGWTDHTADPVQFDADVVFTIDITANVL